MNLFPSRLRGYFRKSNHCKSFSRLALALIFFHVGTATAQPHPDAFPGGPLPPASTQLAFVQEGQIYLVNADGTGLVQLTDSEPGIENSDPAWSRDGQRLAFARGSVVDRLWDIYIMDADGSNVIQLTSGGYDVEPTWGPNDHTILFSSFLSGSMGLSVIDVDDAGSVGSRVLHDYPGWDAQPAWSPDGQTITFTSDYRAYDIVYDLYAMDADGSNVRPLLQGPFEWPGATFHFQSAWSPDGQSIGVVRCVDGSDVCYYYESEIAIANADGSGLRVIAHAGSYAKPTWSPDGRWIAYASSACASCETSIRYVQVDGGIEGLIVENGHSPAWRPDGLNGQSDPGGPVKDPDEPKEPPRYKIPQCELKCDRKKLTGADFPGRQ